MNPLRILYVDTENVWRGGQEQLFSLMAGMKDRGHEVFLAAPFGSPLSEKSARKGILTYPVSQTSELSPSTFRRLCRILGQQSFQVIHFNTPRVVLAGGLASRWRGVPVRISARRVNFPLRSVFSRFKYNWLHSGIITVSRSIRETLLLGGVRPKLVTVIYEGVDLAWIDAQKPQSEGTATCDVTVGTVAHLSPEKGHTILLDAAASLVRRFPYLKYFFIGDGRLRSDLQEKARRLGLGDRVVFTGFRSDCEALMKNFDIFCLPSLSEGLSSAILAAMANRLPVVATTVGGIPELVVDGETGILTPPYDSNRLGAALAELAASMKLRRRMGEAGRRRVEVHFTLSRKLDETEQLYLRLLDSDRIK